MMEDPLLQRYSQLYPQSVWGEFFSILKTATLRAFAMGLVVNIAVYIGMWFGYMSIYERAPRVFELINTSASNRPTEHPMIFYLVMLWGFFSAISFLVYFYGMFGQVIHKYAVISDKFVYDYLKSRRNVEKRCYIFRILAWLYLPGLAIVGAASGPLTALLIGMVWVLYCGIISVGLVWDFSKIEKAWRANNVPA
ncbi:MAG: hypothetical protein MUF38_01480 [Anaerolineae bacterium]|jgi:hypothetical protein|nr:hypothetical protein [Anaerolineae bacterium]